MDVRFSSAIHALTLISETGTPMSSEQIAASVGTNASYIRKLASLMKKAGLIDSRRGASGFWLVKGADQITLLDVYRAVRGTDEVHVFDLHQNSSDACAVGSSLGPVLTAMFRSMEREVELKLAAQTLEDCIDLMAEHVARGSEAATARRT